MTGAQMELELPPVLDACCGSRMMWFDKADPRALFVDRRVETHDVRDRRHPNRSACVIAPDVVADFRDLPFPAESFKVVVMDPPHVTASRTGTNGKFGKFYGTLPADWEDMIRRGFVEAFRVLKPGGVLIFKWAETCYPVKTVLALTPAKPLFGHKTSRHTHWFTFLKEDPQVGATSHNGETVNGN